MDLYILRHGLAEDISESGHDRDRALTSDGREKTAAAGKALRKLEISFDLVLASPFVRAWQTAEIVVAELGCKERLKGCDPLSAGAPIEGMVSALKAAVRHHSSVLAVGHEPDLSRLISLLLSGTTEVHVSMKKGALAKLTWSSPNAGSARLDWLLTAKHLCRIA